MNLEEVLQNFKANTSFSPIIGCELEFYISDSSKISLLDKFSFLKVKKEEGQGQFECDFYKTENILKLSNDVIDFKRFCEKIAKDNNFKVLFAGKPYSSQPPSSLQVNISLIDKNNVNVFNNDLGGESDILLSSVAGLLEYIPKSMIYFAPSEDCKKRFSDYKNAPSTISWGANNRTTALRIPTVTNNIANRRIEHRLPCACSNPQDVFAIILQAIEYGIVNKLNPKIDKTYGNAYDEQYNLDKIFS